MSDDATLGHALLARARNAIADRLGLPLTDEPPHPALHTPGATFVTLTEGGRLRGCIGTLEAHRSLEADVRANAVAAAFRDPRFAPVEIDEWPHIQLEVSLLTTPVPLPCRDEADALARLRPGVDGVIFEYGGYRSTFLPQVWEQLPEPAIFLNQLKRKAGLPDTFWAPEVMLSRYEVCKWKENRRSI